MQPATSASPAAADFACRLLTTEEIQSVLGEAFKNTKPSERSAAGLLVSQCYFELPTTVNSIVLTVTRKAEGGRDPGEPCALHATPFVSRNEQRRYNVADSEVQVEPHR